MGSIYDINSYDRHIFHIDSLPVSNYIYFIPWCKLYIRHYTASIHIFSTMKMFQISREMTRYWHPLNFKPQYPKNFDIDLTFLGFKSRL